MKELKKDLNVKINKHEEKLKAHKESEAILQLEKKELLDKLEMLDSKILSTVKGIEYHTGKLKAYQKVSDMI